MISMQPCLKIEKAAIRRDASVLLGVTLTSSSSHLVWTLHCPHCGLQTDLIRPQAVMFVDTSPMNSPGWKELGGSGWSSNTKGSMYTTSSSTLNLLPFPGMLKGSQIQRWCQHIIGS